MLAATLLLAAGVLAEAQSPQQALTAGLSAGELVRAVIHNELSPANGNDARWKYVLHKDVEGKQELREVVETKAGSLDRLVEVAGKPLSEGEQRAERDRIFRLSHDAEEERKFEDSRRKDAEQCTRFLAMIPDAFVFEYGGESGALIKVTFNPNPGFQAPSREAKVLHEMAGEIWVEARQRRLVSIRGQIVNDVKFGGGLLGHLEKGGQVTVKRSEIQPGHWELTEMDVNMKGKALMFKNIAVQQKEQHTDFHAVPEDLSLADAAGILLHQSVLAAKQ
jgi:hypothetical protein